MTHRAALERAVDPKSRPVYSVFHGLSAGIFRLNFRSLDHKIWSIDVITVSVRSGALLLTHRAALERVGGATCRPIYSVFHGLSAGIFRLNFRSLNHKIWSIDVITVSVRSGALLLTHRAALERAADPKSRPIYSVFHGLSAGLFRLNFRSLDHKIWSIDVITVSVRSGALLLTHRAALERAADPKSRPIYSVFHGLSAGIFRLNFRSLDHKIWSIDVITVGSRSRALLLPPRAALDRAADPTSRLIYSVFHGLSAGIFRLNFRSLDHKIWSIDVITVSVRSGALLLTHRAALERAADLKSRPIYSVFHGLSAGIYSLNYRSIDHKI